MSHKIVLFDTETAKLTGPVCDLAGFVLDDELNILSQFESLIDPQAPIVPAAQVIHGITNEMVATAPTMPEYVEQWGNPFITDEGEELIVIGHNVQFDCRMVADLLPPAYTKVCTLRMSRNKWPDLKEDEENHKLGTLAIMFGLETGPAHRAMGDAVTCLNLLRYIVDTSAVESFDDLILLGKRSLSLETKIGFGKHRGTKLKDLPSSYVSWLLNQSEMDPDLKEALQPRIK